LAELAELKGEGVFPFEWRSIEEWKGFFEEAGWELQEMKTKEMVYHFSTVREVFQQWHGIGSVSQTESKLALSVMRELMHEAAVVSAR